MRPQRRMNFILDRYAKKWLICRRGGPRHGPPHPPEFGAPRGTRGAPRRPARGCSSVAVGGPDMAPHTPPRSERPGEPVALLDDPRVASHRSTWGATTWPPTSTIRLA